jgi:hypothetical protein
MLAALRPLRTELIGVAGLTALLLAAAGFVAARLLAFDLPPACFAFESLDPACAGRQFDVITYQAFSNSWVAPIAFVGAMFPSIAGVVLGIAAVAKELELRTAVLAWSVGPSRRKWMVQRIFPLLSIVALLGLGSTQLFAAMMRLNNPGADPFSVATFELISVTGFAPMAAGISAFGLTVVVGAMLGRLLPGLMIAGAFVIVTAVLIQQGNERLMAGESLVAEPMFAGAGRQIDSMLRTPDGRVISWNDAFPDYADVNTGQPLPGVTEMVRYVPIEIYPQVAARYVLFHLLVGFFGLTLAFAVVERRSP